jgi:hypothetical protein
MGQTVAKVPDASGVDFGRPRAKAGRVFDITSAKEREPES